MEKDSGNKKKAKLTFSSKEAVRYLRRLADQLEAGAIQISNQEMEFGEEVKVKESFKSAKGNTVVKVQFKFSSPETPAAADQTSPDTAEKEPVAPMAAAKASSYKKLKKLMAKQLGELDDVLKAGGEPGPAALAFADSCLQMVAFADPDKGAAHYPEFQAQAQALRAAGRAGDLEALRQAVMDLKALKKTCHGQYK
ncbi:MAG: GAK system XXXCH domain-containing protein [Thermodesulfobacteriota bacterium]